MAMDNSNNNVLSRLRFILDNPVTEVIIDNKHRINEMYREIFDRQLRAKIGMYPENGVVYWGYKDEPTKFTYEYDQPVDYVKVQWESYLNSKKFDFKKFARMLAGPRTWENLDYFEVAREIL